MKIEIDTDTNTLRIQENGQKQSLPLYSTRGFEILSDVWVKVGWNQKHPYTFTWWGRPIIQNPEDVLRIQEVLFALKPDYVVETGIAHGGTLVFYASLFEAVNHGKVIGVDIEIRPHNRKAIEAHPMAKRIALVEGNSTSPEVVAQVKKLIPEGSKVLVILDSNHTKAHVMGELHAYHDLVSVGSYIVATDGIMNILHDVPRGTPSWILDNPTEAAREFAEQNPNFIVEQPAWLFNESELSQNVTHWPGAWLKRVK
jgi:cephalosporin hydroxylase